MSDNLRYRLIVIKNYSDIKFFHLLLDLCFDWVFFCNSKLWYFIIICGRYNDSVTHDLEAMFGIFNQVGWNNWSLRNLVNHYILICTLLNTDNLYIYWKKSIHNFMVCSGIHTKDRSEFCFVHKAFEAERVAK